MEHFLELFVTVVLKVALPLIECTIKVIECRLKIIEVKKKSAVSTPKKTQRSSVRRHTHKIIKRMLLFHRCDRLSLRHFVSLRVSRKIFRLPRRSAGPAIPAVRLSGSSGAGPKQPSAPAESPHLLGLGHLLPETPR
mgnify:CR=1 FL=1